MRFLLALLMAVLLIPAAAPAAPVTVPLSVTPPAPAAFTTQVSQSATVNGAVYTVTGTLTFTPTGAFGSLPAGPGNPPPASLSALPEGTATPMIAGFRSTDGQWVESFAAGDPVYVEGRGWGVATGTVRVAARPCSVFEWIDEEIGFSLPPDTQAAPSGATLEVRRPDGAYVYSRGFAVRSLQIPAAQNVDRAPDPLAERQQGHALFRGAEPVPYSSIAANKVIAAIDGTAALGTKP